MPFPLIPVLIGGGLVAFAALRATAEKSSGGGGGGGSAGNWSDGLADGALTGETTYTDSRGRYWVYGPVGFMTMMRDSSGTPTVVPRPTVSMMGILHRSELAQKLETA